MVDTLRTKTFRDIGISFAAHPRKGDVVTVTNDDAIKQHLDILVRSQPSDFLFHPEINAGVHALLFENWTPHVKRTLERSVAESIRQHEPRINLISVTATFVESQSALEVTFLYRIKNEPRDVQYTTFIERSL